LRFTKPVATDSLIIARYGRTVNPINPKILILW
jgi:hypothetical protein